MRKKIINSLVKKDNIIRYDFISRTLLKIIEKVKLNQKYKWVKYDLYLLYHKEVIDENKINNLESQPEITTLINMINNLQIENKNINIIDSEKKEKEDMNSSDSNNQEEDSKNDDNNVDEKLFNNEPSVISIINMIEEVEKEESNKISKLKIKNKNFNSNNIIITKFKQKDSIIYRENNNNIPLNLKIQLRMKLLIIY